MTDYGCHPLWEVLDGGARNVPVEALSIAADLASQLRAWAQRYDETLDRENPAASGFGSEEDKLEFEQIGRHIWRALAEQLGPAVKVTHFSEMEQRELE